MAGYAASPVEAAPASDEDLIEKTWNECYSLGKQSIVLVYQNKFLEAEQILETLSEKAAQRAEAFPTEPDPRSLPVMLTSLTTLVRGASRLEKEQLTQFSERMEQAETVVELGPDWPGKDLNRAGALIICGAIKINQQQFVSGVWKLLRAVTSLSGGAVMKAALSYEGREKEAVRPFATLISAMAHIITSGLPPWTKGAASWLMGDTMDRKEGLLLMESLYREDTLLKPVACGILLEHYLDHENKGIMIEAKEEEMVPQLLKYANDEFPDCFLYSNVRCIYEARKRNIEVAYGVAERILKISEYKGIQLIAYGKMGLYAICMLDWSLAARHYRAGLEILQSVDRRALCPVYAAYASLCYIMAGDMLQAQEMILVVREYRKAKKKDWGEQDKYAFYIMESAPSQIRSFNDHPSNGEGKQPFRPFMSLMFLVGPASQSFQFMKLEAAQQLIDMVKKYMQGHTAISGDTGDASDSAMVAALSVGSQDECSKALSSVVLTDAYLSLKRYSEASEVCDASLALLALKKDAGAEEMGATPYLRFMKAKICFETGDVMSAKNELIKYSKCGTSYYGFTALSFRVAELSLSVGVKLDSQYQELMVKARQQEVMLKVVPEECCSKEIQWDFTLAQHTISFSVFFQAAGGDTWVLVQGTKEHDSKEGPVSGSFQPDQPGVLKFTFDNSSSWTRGKTVMWRTEPQLQESTKP